MQDVPRVPTAAKLALLIGCPLLSAATLAAIAVGVAALIGAAPVLTIGAIVAGAVFVVNASALSLALTRGEIDQQMASSIVVEADAAQRALAS